MDYESKNTSIDYVRLEKVQLDVAEVIRKLSDTVTELTLTVNKQAAIHDGFKDLCELQIRVILDKQAEFLENSKSIETRLRGIEDKMNEGKGFLSGTSKTASFIWGVLVAIAGAIGWLLGK